MAESTDSTDECLALLKDSAEKACLQWTSAGTEFHSFPQRADLGFDELLALFDAKNVDDAWLSEYSDIQLGRREKLVSYRRKLAFLQASAKEFHEEYDPDVTDVDFMRLLEVAYTDPEYVIDFSREEIGGTP